MRTEHDEAVEAIGRRHQERPLAKLTNRELQTLYNLSYHRHLFADLTRADLGVLGELVERERAERVNDLERADFVPSDPPA